MDKPNDHDDINLRLDQEARDWLVRLTSGDVDERHLEKFREWRARSDKHRIAFDRERFFWQQLQELGDHDTAKLRAAQSAQSAKKISWGRRAFIIGGATATAGIIAAPQFRIWWNTSFATGIGEQAEFTLPDGSTAALNTDSAVAVKFRPNLRLVELLKGEAEFRVNPDDAGLFRVAALGGNSDGKDADFSVKAIDDVASVTVSRGNIQVTGPASPDDMADASGSHVFLQENQQTTYALGTIPGPGVSIDSEEVFAWRKGQIIFDARPLAAAIMEIGRYLPERIVLGPSVESNDPVSAVFSARQAFAAIQALAKTQGLSVRRVPGLVILIS
ncbi:FecR domain-containing protein [Phyllobacterium sp. SB3]|uniref:FecR family protein n=1 Tax=Phyllobacterium sp. SB3 TaxID=3156073 RepID=UPI0032AF74EE